MKTEENKVIHSSFWENVFKNTPNKSELTEVLKEVSPFSELKKPFLNQVLKMLHNRKYVAGEYIFHQGDPGIGMYIIQEGKVEIEFTSPSKRKIILANFGRCDFFGELALLDGEKRSASALAKTDCSISILFKPDLDELIEMNPKEGIIILSGINRIISTRLRNLNQDYIILQDKLYELNEVNHEY
jgi:CRP-like cAMP-binding protein